MHQISKQRRIRKGSFVLSQCPWHGLDLILFKQWQVNIPAKNGIAEKTVILLSLNKGFDKFLTTLCGVGGGEGNDIFLALIIFLMTSVYKRVKIQELQKVLIFTSGYFDLDKCIFCSCTFSVGHLRDKKPLEHWNKVNSRIIHCHEM